MSYMQGGDDPQAPQSKRMTDSELRALLENEKSDALAATQASTLSGERERAMRYYLGEMDRDMPPGDGRSHAISTDVSDTIEGLMPNLMEIFCGGDDVVRFEPVGPEDVQAAAQETDYVNHVFMQKNPGFLVLYSFIKDALLSKNGFAKVWTETEQREEKITYYDQPDDAFALITYNPEFKVVAHTMKQGPFGNLHDVTVVCTKDYKCHKVACVPPEEVGIARNATSIADAGYVFHETMTSVALAIDQGYDADVIRSLPSYNASSSPTQYNSEAQARDTVNEGSQSGGGDEDVNDANRQVRITEHYIRMDYEGDGKARLYRVCTGGDNVILTVGGQEQIIEIDAIPIATMTPVPQTHRIFGRSVADLVMDIQQQKTALYRAMLDNMYMSVNPRPVVYESNSGPQTLDDLLMMRPGQPIRAKTPGAIEWQEVPNIAGAVLPVVQFLDSVREWRTGVSRMGQGVDPNALQNQVATIANQMYSQSQAKVKLIARIFAETGIKDMFSLLHKEIRRYGDQAQTVRLRNQWVTVNPSDWKERDDMTITVGLGTGSKAEQLAQWNILKDAQVQGIQIGLVSQRNLYNTAKKLVNLLGEKDVDTYFVAPDQPPNPQDPSSAPIPPPPDPDAKKNQADLIANQQKGQLEQQKAAADVQREAAQAQSEITIAQAKAQLETQLKLLDAEIKKDQHRMDMEKHAAALAVQDRKAQNPPKASIEVKHGADQLTEPMSEILRELTQHLSQQQAAHTQAVLDALANHAKPKRIKKVGNGEYVTETVQ